MTRDGPPMTHSIPDNVFQLNQNIKPVASPA
jgi:hypothetical protein